MVNVFCLGMVFVVVALARTILLAVKQYRSMQLFERAESGLQLQKAEYARVLELSCRSFRSSPKFVGDSLRRIHLLLTIRREELLRVGQAIQAGHCSEELDAQLMASA